MPTSKKTPSLASIEAQIKALQKQAADIRANEVGGVVARMKEAIAHYGLTAVDLGLAKKPGRRSASDAAGPAAEAKPAAKKRGRKPGAKKKAAVAAAFTDGQGKTWSGRGRRPEWYKAAIAAGKTDDDLRIKASE